MILSQIIIIIKFYNKPKTLLIQKDNKKLFKIIKSWKAKMNF